MNKQRTPCKHVVLDRIKERKYTAIEKCICTELYMIHYNNLTTTISELETAKKHFNSSPISKFINKLKSIIIKDR